MSENTYPHDAWVQLGRLVKRRRIELGMGQAAVNAAGGPSVGVISKIENAKQTFYEDRVFADLERAIRWKAGSAEKILQGKSPTPLSPPGALPPLAMDARGTVSEPRAMEGESPIASYLNGLLAGVNERLAELNEKVDQQNRRIEELQQNRRPDEEDRRHTGT